MTTLFYILAPALVALLVVQTVRAWWFKRLYKTGVELTRRLTEQNETLMIRWRQAERDACFTRVARGKLEGEDEWADIIE